MFIKNLSYLRKLDCESVYFTESVYSWLNFSLRGKLFPIPPSARPSFATKMTFRLRLAEIPCCTFEHQNNIFKLVSCQRLLMVARYCWSDVIVTGSFFNRLSFFSQSRPEGGSNVHRYAVGVMSSLAMLIAFSTLSHRCQRRDFVFVSRSGSLNKSDGYTHTQTHTFRGA